MPSEIKFTNFGIPYLVEFANINIRTPSLKGKNKKQALEKLKGKKGEKADKREEGKENKPKLPPPPVRCPTCGHLPEHQTAKLSPVVEEKKAPAHPGGLYIRFQVQDPNAPPKKISERRLVRLRWLIANAVQKAGMTSPSPAELTVPDGPSFGTGTMKSTSTYSTKSRQLYKGTYGQVKEALHEAGLVAVPCDENGFENGTRLGALFVVNSNANAKDGVELTKLTLWG